MRVLLLGTTGVQNNVVWARLDQERTGQAASRGEGTAHVPRFLDFEKEYLQPQSGTLFGFLDATEREQQHCWETAWAQLHGDLAGSSEDLALAVHATFVREDFGTRAFLAPERLRGLGITHVVTLMDDVYSCWWQTEARAARDHWIGRPTLLQLIHGRQAELLLGDLLARSLGLSNILLSALHPARVLDRLLFSSGRPRIVYLSFPISGPRKRGDSTGIDEISGYLKMAAAVERERRGVVCLCPLAIDELPMTNLDLPRFKKVRDDPKKPEDHLRFCPADHRWDVRAFWPSDILMSDVIHDTMELPLSQVLAVSGALLDEVGVRDYRLLAQSSALGVFNPRFDRERPRGVRAEMDRALATARAVHIFQDRAYDRSGVIRKEYASSGGTMGTARRLLYSKVHPDLKTMLDEALSLA